MATIRKQITLTPLAAGMLNRVADMEGQSESSLIDLAIREYVERHTPEIENEVRKTLKGTQNREVKQNG